MFKKIIILYAILMVGGCVVPVTHGPYYHPSYPDMNSPDSPSFPYFGSSVQSRAYFKVGNDCYMQLEVIPVDKNSILAWNLIRYGKNNDACHFVIGKESISIEDANTGLHTTSESVHRIFTGPGTLKPAFDFRSGMQPYSRYLSDVPSDQQTYTVSIPLRLGVAEKIPASVSIRLPDILIGDQRVVVPMLTLKSVETGGNINAYVPVSALPMTNAESVTGFGMSSTYHRTSGSMAMFFAGATLWHEEKGLLRVASSFSGRDDVKTSAMIKPEVSGEILIQVMSGKGIRLSDSKVTWVTEGGNEISQQIDTSNFRLSSYRTSLSDATLFEEKDFGPSFVILLPGFHPGRVRVTLPSLNVNSKLWNFEPIDFEYRPGGIGFLPWP